MIALASVFAGSVSAADDLFATGYRNAESLFRLQGRDDLDLIDKEWIEQRELRLQRQNAVTVHSMWLPAQDSMCEVGLQVLFFEDADCEGRFCRMVIKCRSRTAADRLSMTLTARKAIAIAAWSFEPRWFDACQRQGIQVSTPSGVLLVIIGRFGFEIADPNLHSPGCGSGQSF
ncbi:hypothetical protein [Bradyrhizobium sp. STM 3809]|uniref:hypothetical protein n=1 Tax=Bradyrhizobium sp. STM 3809 TaxID=551936 RepID=UPI0002F9C842|nr:hypothetical protein [Bradyrhizobium sp. STM 3809]